jgi:hypothetical protein
LPFGGRVEEIVVKIKVDCTFLEHSRDPSGLAIQSHICNTNGHCVAVCPSDRFGNLLRNARVSKPLNVQEHDDRESVLGLGWHGDDVAEPLNAPSMKERLAEIVRDRYGSRQLAV